jgi:hypothetical protein
LDGGRGGVFRAETDVDVADQVFPNIITDLRITKG